MGIEDPLAPTTDFYDLHRAQCAALLTVAQQYAATKPIAAQLATILQNHIDKCDAAIAAGRRSVDMTKVTTILSALVAKYQNLDAATKAAIEQAVRDAQTAQAQQQVTP